MRYPIEFSQNTLVYNNHHLQTVKMKHCWIETINGKKPGKEMDYNTMAFVEKRKNMLTVIQRNTQVNSLHKYFSKILFLLHITGVDVTSCPESVKTNKLCRWLWQSPKYIFNLCVLSILYIQLNWLITQREKRKEVALFFILLIQSSAHYRLHVSRQRIGTWLENLSKVANKLQYSGNSRRLKIFVWLYCITFSLLVIGLMAWHFYSGENEEVLKQCSRSFAEVKIFKDSFKYCYTIQCIMMIVFPLVLGGILVPFTAFYSFTCIYIYLLYDKLNSQLRNSVVLKEFHRLLVACEVINDVVTSLDDHFSYSAFVTVLSSMAGIFRASFVLLFEGEKNPMTLIYYAIAGLLYLAVFLSTILSASAATQEGRIAKELIVSLPGKFPSHYKELKVTLRKHFKREVVLTLWKMYTIERSILISALGTLVTYGILIATLGNVGNGKVGND
ncbi:uncharacterized protein CDAR_498341 [Caerostris darwini]|uniref:Gustatory receptor n=1 Tax=Caerostris darwini TaxID=1538125 RepID=A0AAV4U017_9ARAC|nr:uncharacterized protein CDAR_498341 [Caerostris darwini]